MKVEIRLKKTGAKRGRVTLRFTAQNPKDGKLLADALNKAHGIKDAPLAPSQP